MGYSLPGSFQQDLAFAVQEQNFRCASVHFGTVAEIQAFIGGGQALRFSDKISSWIRHRGAGAAKGALAPQLS